MNTPVAGPGPGKVRSVIYYRTEPHAGEPRVPIAVLAEDRSGVWIEPIGDAVDLPGWCTRGPVRGDHAVLRQRSIPRPLEPSYDRLEFFTRASLSSAMVGRYHYGEFTEHPDWHRLAPELADMLARALAAAR